MTVHTELKSAAYDELYLDPRNPRLGGRFTEGPYSEESLLKEMLNWGLDELASSLVQNGYFAQEPVIAVREVVDGSPGLIVVEGNRRLATLKLLQVYRAGEFAGKRKWGDIIASAPGSRLDDLRTVPYLLADDRDDVLPYLGFRHVTGIKQWEPAEKAAFIAYMIDVKRMSYDAVRRAIGSKTPTVRQHYIAHRILREMEEASESIAVEKVKDRFSVLYLSLRAPGVQGFLRFDPMADPGSARTPVPSENVSALIEYAKWLFGDADSDSIVHDSRDIDRFGEILATPDALDYLRRNPRASFETAYRFVKGSAPTIARLLNQAADAIEEALGFVHFVAEDPHVVRAARRLGADADQLKTHFPEPSAESPVVS